jgi:hypothetical protein
MTEEADTHRFLSFLEDLSVATAINPNNNARTALRWGVSFRHFYLGGYVQCTMTRAEGEGGKGAPLYELYADI